MGSLFTQFHPVSLQVIDLVAVFEIIRILEGTRITTEQLEVSARAVKDDGEGRAMAWIAVVVAGDSRFSGLSPSHRHYMDHQLLSLSPSLSICLFILISMASFFISFPPSPNRPPDWPSTSTSCAGRRPTSSWRDRPRTCSRNGETI